MAEVAPEKSSDADLELSKIHYRARIFELAITGVTTVLSILSFSLPLYVVYLTVGVLAGKNTQVSRGVADTVAGMVGGSSALAVVVAGLAKYNGQRRELVRLRKRCEALESRLRKKGSRK